MSQRWESGSEYHWPSFEPRAAASRWPWDAAGSLWGSGRDAFRALLQHGRAQLGWRRLWCPDFFCQEVLTALLTTGLELRVYRDDPDQAPPSLGGLAAEPGDAILVLNFFGLRAGPVDYGVPAGVVVIEDHTHDPASPWARASAADYCVASLRKTLPIPDGGALWSPVGHQVPESRPATPARLMASAQKLAAMVLKTSYLEGSSVEKEAFRAVSIEAERHIASGEISGMPTWTRQLLQTFPIDDWWQRRRANHAWLASALASEARVRVAQAADGATPLSAYLIFDTLDLRTRVRAALIGASVYPAILWTLEEPAVAGIAEVAVDLSRRSLSVHCDFRYDQADMARVVTVIQAAVGA